MLCDNLKKFRKLKGLSQEELAVKVNVVRQTISKWEKGLSVPDAEMLVRIAKELDTSVNVLLGETIEADDHSEQKEVAAKLEILNEQFAKRSEKRRKIWRLIFIIIAVLVIISLLHRLVDLIYFRSVMEDINSNTSIIGGYDGPTNIYISNMSFKRSNLIITIVAAIVSVVGIYKTRKNKVT